MNGASIGQKLNAWLSVVVFATLIAITAGCGTTGDSSTIAGVGTGGTGTVSGKVADGYLVNATVFLDKNGNYQLDAGEPSTTTDADGAYKLNVDPADVGKYPIVAHVIKGVAIDKDTNQTVANSYVLSMSKDSVTDSVSNNFISPITSLVREMMETGKYASLQQAMDALSAKMGLLPDTNITADYIAANNTAMHTAAQNMATLMGNQMGQVLGTNGSTITVDVNRYRSMMGIIFTNMSAVMSANTQTEMSNLSNSMSSMLSGIPSMVPGQPYQNMTSAYRGTK
jgi:hypothetical protein